ncbi:MAG: PilZ domain-containing protein [Lachnospiraceae bacterium]|nr:PilZ domain-containing protein [Lachnospiraceae bacterium]
MEEKRKAVRTELTSRLIVKQLTGGDGVKEVAIEVNDVSKTGVGFDCTEKLEIGAIYEGFLTIWTKEVLHAFMEIVRIVKDEDHYVYGAIFVGMPETESQRIEVYQAFNK